MSREDFFNWLNSCPSDKWLQIGDDEGSIKIKFFIDEDLDLIGGAIMFEDEDDA